MNCDAIGERFQAFARLVFDVRAIDSGEMVFLNVNDYVESRAFQNSGGALGTVISTDQQSRFNLFWKSN